MRFPCLNAIQRFTYQRETWTQRDQDRLIRMINTKYRNTVPGNWDVVVQLLKDASANHRKPWTAELLTELQDLRVGSRSPNSCRTFWRSQQKVPSGKWSEKERRRLVEVLEATPKHTRVDAHFGADLHRARAALSYHTYSKWTAGRIRTLMDCVGGVTVSMCQTKYQAIRAKSAACGVARWTAEEVDRLDSASATKTTKQCYVKWYRCLRPAKYPAE
ncbi:hypothetical protein DL89DRAFT_323763 [Linderina pennispora]|uniref:Myb-like domain-containing protein n=1 Tax=Linderina pennispora TaxID=61395 RepID=A0A1Y1W3Q3_9FUNG|nr:uncharacterized protein DL89DRAFT_323763 [Linderina pennispora]ORX68173.1 hypothetical protein DL89DRAFT_323763 [Linderina pennispora]